MFTVRSTTQSYMNSGYRLIGVSNFTKLIGQPMRAQALAYAKQIGANLVVYAMAPIGQEVHPVNRLVMNSPGATSPLILPQTPTEISTFTATSTTYVPAQFHTQVVPETFSGPSTPWRFSPTELCGLRRNP